MIATSTEIKRVLQTHTRNGQIFQVTFIKRTTGERRRMVCRLGVRAHLKGGALNYDPSALNLLPVFDMQAQEYRSIPLDAVQSARIAGITYEVVK